VSPPRSADPVLLTTRGGVGRHRAARLALTPPRSELPAPTEQDDVVGERRIAMAAGDQTVGDAPRAIAVDGVWNRQRERVGASRVADARFGRDGVSGAPEAVAVADQVLHRDAFESAAQAHSEPLPALAGVARSDPGHVLIGHRHDLLAAVAAEGGRAVGVPR